MWAPCLSIAAQPRGVGAAPLLDRGGGARWSSLLGVEETRR